MMGFAFKKPQEIKFGILMLGGICNAMKCSVAPVCERLVPRSRRQMSSNVILTPNTPHTDYLWAELVEVLSSPVLLSTMQG